MTKYKQDHFQDAWSDIPGVGSFYVACLHGKVVVARFPGGTWLVHPGRSSRATAKAMNRGLEQLGLTQYVVDFMETARKDQYYQKFLALRVRGSEHFTELEPGLTRL